MSRAINTVEVFTHRNPQGTQDAVEKVVAIAAERGCQLVFSGEEAEKHGIDASDRITVGEAGGTPDLALALGGDGTILYAMRKYLEEQVPALAVNYGRIGFLATVEREGLEEGLELAFEGNFETMGLPSLVVELDDEQHYAVNDITFTRRPESRVADLSYSLSGEKIGDVRCDGIVASTPAGSTGYNLANGGPIVAWGVEGYVISFIAPHTISARPMLAAAQDVLTVGNTSIYDSVDVSIDGRKIGVLDSGAAVPVRLSDRRALLAQMPGSNFYYQFRDKFGKL